MEKLKEKGYVEAISDKDGNRPEKTVYSITEDGEKYFAILLKKMQEEILNFEFPLDGAIFFNERIEPDDFLSSLKSAKQTVESKLKNLIAHRENAMLVIPEAGKSSAQAIFSHHIYHLRAELEWLKEIEKGLDK